jgi:hypothetical protein
MKRGCFRCLKEKSGYVDQPTRRNITEDRNLNVNVVVNSNFIAYRLTFPPVTEMHMILPVTPCSLVDRYQGFGGKSRSPYSIHEDCRANKMKFLVSSYFCCSVQHKCHRHLLILSWRWRQKIALKRWCVATWSHNPLVCHHYLSIIKYLCTNLMWSDTHQQIWQNFYFLPTQCIYVFCVDLRTNSDYFPIQH